MWNSTLHSNFSLYHPPFFHLPLPPTLASTLQPSSLPFSSLSLFLKCMFYYFILPYTNIQGKYTSFVLVWLRRRWCGGSVMSFRLWYHIVQDTTLIQDHIMSHRQCHSFWGHLKIMCTKCKNYITALKTLTYWINIYWGLLSAKHSTKKNYKNKYQEKWKQGRRPTWSSLSFSRKAFRTGI